MTSCLQPLDCNNEKNQLFELAATSPGLVAAVLGDATGDTANNSAATAANACQALKRARRLREHGEGFSDSKPSVRAGAPGSPVSAALPVEASCCLKLVGMLWDQGHCCHLLPAKASSNLISAAEWWLERGIKPTRGGKAQCIRTPAFSEPTRKLLKCPASWSCRGKSAHSAACQAKPRL